MIDFPHCFKCDKEILPFGWGTEEEMAKEVWEVPCGVLFEGGWNSGSSLYDAGFDGIYVKIVVCDECVAEAKGSSRLKEFRRGAS